MLKATLKRQFRLLSVLAKRFSIDVQKGYEYASDQLYLRTSSACKLSKNGVFSGPYFPVFGLNTGKYGPEKTPFLGSFHAV